MSIRKISELPIVKIGDENFIAIMDTWKPPQIITFCDENHTVIGTIDFSGSELSFSGKADATAKVFFDTLIVCNSAYIKGLQDEINSLKKE